MHLPYGSFTPASSLSPWEQLARTNPFLTNEEQSQFQNHPYSGLCHLISLRYSSTLVISTMHFEKEEMMYLCPVFARRFAKVILVKLCLFVVLFLIDIGCAILEVIGDLEVRLIDCI